MARGGLDRCSGCLHPERAKIDAALASGVSLRWIAREYGLSPSAVHRHKAHRSGSLVRVTPGEIIARTNGNGNGHGPTSSEDVLGALQRLFKICEDALQVAAESGNVLQFNLASRELRRALDTLGKQIERVEAKRGAPVINLETTKQWVSLRLAITRALRPFPKANFAVAEAIEAEFGDPNRAPLPPYTGPNPDYLVGGREHPEYKEYHDDE
jgi:lambda repressor-like predicted transcriptional regulator